MCPEKASFEMRRPESAGSIVHPINGLEEEALSEECNAEPIPFVGTRFGLREILHCVRCCSGPEKNPIPKKKRFFSKTTSFGLASTGKATAGCSATPEKRPNATTTQFFITYAYCTAHLAILNSCTAIRDDFQRDMPFD